VRRLGSQRIVLETLDGSFTGRFVTDALPDRALVVLFADERAEPSEPLVVPLDRILSATAVC
jgi:hypothetical protein